MKYNYSSSLQPHWNLQQGYGKEAVINMNFCTFALAFLSLFFNQSQSIKKAWELIYWTGLSLFINFLNGKRQKSESPQSSGKTGPNGL